jgi:hypothetical protein
MKTKLHRTFLAALFALIGFALDVTLSRCAVTNSYCLLNPDGTPYTNVATMTAYPPATASVTVVGTNIVIGGGYTITLTPNSNGIGTVVSMPGSYTVFEPSNNVSFPVNIPNVTGISNLSSWVNAPTVYTPGSLYALITNALGCNPVASNSAAVVSALGWTPLTNSQAAVSNTLALNYNAVTNALNFNPATNWPNGYSGIFTFSNGVVTNTLHITNSIVITNTTP